MLSSLPGESCFKFHALGGWNDGGPYDLGGRNVLGGRNDLGGRNVLGGRNDLRFGTSMARGSTRDSGFGTFPSRRHFPCAADFPSRRDPLRAARLRPPPRPPPRGRALAPPSPGHRSAPPRSTPRARQKRLALQRLARGLAPGRPRVPPRRRAPRAAVGIQPTARLERGPARPSSAQARRADRRARRRLAERLAPHSSSPTAHALARCRSDPVVPASVRADSREAAPPPPPAPPSAPRAGSSSESSVLDASQGWRASGPARPLAGRPCSVFRPVKRLSKRTRQGALDLTRRSTSPRTCAEDRAAAASRQMRAPGGLTEASSEKPRGGSLRATGTIWSLVPRATVPPRAPRFAQARVLGGFGRFGLGARPRLHST